MKNGISKSRIRRISSIRRKRQAAAAAAAAGDSTSFKNGTPLAVLYLILTFCFSSFCLLWARYDIETVSAIKENFHYLALIHLFILVTSAVTGRLLLGRLTTTLLKRNSRILLLCVVATLATLLQLAVMVFGKKYGIELFLPDPNAADEVLPFLMPFLFAPALATLLIGRGAGTAMGIAMMLQNLLLVRPNMMLPFILIGIIIAVCVPGILAPVRHRSSLMPIFLGVGVIQCFGIAVHVVLRAGGFHEFNDSLTLRQIFQADLIATILSLVIDFFATVSLLPFLEHIFGACSNIRLNTYADLNSPLLMRLNREAPGTYHHSINVADLAAAAADRIGANPILARVGSYYHDIGKLNTPAAFTENIGVGQTNPHDSIPPSMSALILASHVKDGVGFALDCNLPIPIRNIISEHHGNSLMAFFYNKAIKQAEAKAKQSGTEPEPVDENLFRYSSPRPSFPEAAIICLADSVEAASRSLVNPTPSTIEKLVNSIIDQKIQDGQLDASPLTFADVVLIKRVFTKTLTTLLHSRIAYPKLPKDEPAARPVASASEALQNVGEAPSVIADAAPLTVPLTPPPEPLSRPKNQEG